MLLFVFSMGILFTNAQNDFKKGNLFLEGSVGYSKVKGIDANYNFQPTLGYFFSDKIAGGLSVSLGKTAGVETTGFGAFGRYYFLNIGKNFKTFTQAGIGTSSTSSISTFKLNVGLGANYFVTNHLALSVGLADLVTYTSNKATSSFGIGWDGVNNPLNAGNFGVLYRF